MTPPPKISILKKSLERVVRNADKLSLLLIVLGCVGFLALPALEKKVAFEEKALIAGAVLPSLSRTVNEEVLHAAVRFVQQAVAHGGSTHPQQRQSARDWLVEKLSQLPLEVYQSSYNSSSRGSKAVPCTTVHAVVRARGGDGKEGLVLVTPISLAGQSVTEVSPAIVLGSAYVLALHLASVHWLARDFVWLIPDGSCDVTEGVERWVHTYHYPPAGEVPGMFGRAGSLQQTVIVEAHGSGPVDSWEVRTEGMDGRVPRLDLYQLIRFLGVSVFQRELLLGGEGQAEAVAVALGWSLESERYLRHVVTAAYVAWRHACGIPTGAHGSFREHNIDAVTLALHSKPPGLHPHLPSEVEIVDRMRVLADLLEMTFRTLNNLSERFHHALFLYLLTSPGTLVSVETYIAPLVVLLLVLPLQAASCHQHSLNLIREGRPSTHGSAMARVLLLQAGCACLGVALRGVASFKGTSQGLEERIGIEPGGGVVAVLAGLLVAASGAAVLSTPSSGQKVIPEDRPVSGAPNWIQIKIAMLSCTAVTLAPLSCFNWALTYVAALVLVPLLASARPLFMPHPRSHQRHDVGSGNGGVDGSSGDGSSSVIAPTYNAAAAAITATAAAAAVSAPNQDTAAPCAAAAAAADAGAAAVPTGGGGGGSGHSSSGDVGGSSGIAGVDSGSRGDGDIRGSSGIGISGIGGNASGDSGCSSRVTVGSAGDGNHGNGGRGGLVALLCVGVFSPFVLFGPYVFYNNAGSPWDAIVSFVHQSSMTSYLLFWCVYLPMWLLCIHITFQWPRTWFSPHDIKSRESSLAPSSVDPLPLFLNPTAAK